MKPQVNTTGCGWAEAFPGAKILHALSEKLSLRKVGKVFAHAVTCKS